MLLTASPSNLWEPMSKPSYGSHYSSSFCTANWILYRLTDVMLMKAEALVCMAPDDENDATANKHLRDSLLRAGYSIVNTINRRSDCNTIHTDIDYTTYASKTQMLNLVYDERERELMFEGKRWYDLVRRSLRDGNTKYLISKVTQKGSDNASVLQSKALPRWMPCSGHITKRNSRSIHI